MCLSTLFEYIFCLISLQDALIPAYPKISNDEKNRFIRDELEIFL